MRQICPLSVLGWRSELLRSVHLFSSVQCASKDQMLPKLSRWWCSWYLKLFLFGRNRWRKQPSCGKQPPGYLLVLALCLNTKTNTCRKTENQLFQQLLNFSDYWSKLIRGNLWAPVVIREAFIGIETVMQYSSGYKYGLGTKDKRTRYKSQLYTLNS